ncbi:MAG: TIGR02281 family clan AA aspartic protease [Thermodesulfobacteriota bacterium]|nr:TIGR02281 family clan AA aspartic protease [Thermodesulfobacteriota bacterium]
MTTSTIRHIISVILWLAIFIIVLMVFFYLDGHRTSVYPEQRTANQYKDHEQQNTGYGRVVLHAMRSGHFDVKAYINDYSVNLLADTGATYVILTWEDADTLGLTYDLKFIAQVHTANGISTVAPVMLDSIEIGTIQVENVHACVAEEGKLKQSLLGMSFIGRLESFHMSGQELILVQ